MQKSKGSILSLLFMIVISCVTQIVCIMKSAIVASKFGASEAMDAYNFSNSLFSFIVGIIVSGVPTVILPAYVKQREKNGIDSFITLLYGSLFFFIGITVLFRYQIVSIFTNRSEMFVNIVCNTLLILAITQYLSTFTGITTAYLQNKGKYNTPKIINLISQIVVLILLVYKKNVDIYDYTLIISVGLLITFVLDTGYALIEGWRFVPRLFIKNEVTQNLLHTFLPILFSSSIYKLSLFVDSMIASNLDEGKLTLLNYSSMIVGMVNTLIVGNILIYIYPKLIKRLKDGNEQSYFWNQVSFFHMIICLLIVGFFSIGKDGITVLFQRGLFDASATRYVYLGALLYMLGQQFNIVRDLMYRYFYCMGNTKIPAQNSILVSIINIGISLVLVHYMGFFGIIIGTVLASAISMAIIILRFHKDVKLDCSFKIFLFGYLKNISAMFATGMIVFVTKLLLCVDNCLLSILFFGVETAVVYVGIVSLINKSVLYAVKE